MDANVPPLWLERIDRLLSPDGRRLLGLVGPPGAGKSSLAAALAKALGRRAALAPMDGFHLAGSELKRLGRAGRKGAPDTFDAAGFVALLRRLKAPKAGEIIYAPDFRREIEEAIAGAIPIPHDVPLVIVEGNYLLCEGHGFGAVRELLDECWYLDIDRERRIERLVARHVRHGRPQDEARAWVLGSDEANAALVEASRDRADVFLRWPPKGEAP